MPDTVRTLAALQSLLADNVTEDISPQDVRDFLVSAWTPEWVHYLNHRLPDETAHVDDDFFDSDTSADYTEHTVSGTADWAIARGLLSSTTTLQTDNDLSVFVKPITSASAPMTIETRMNFLAPFTDNPHAGLVFTDGVVDGSTAVQVHLRMDATSTDTRVLLIAGTLTNEGVIGNNIVATRIGMGFFSIYLRLIWISANTWNAAVSVDGNLWYSAAADLAATITPTHFGFVSTADGAGSDITSASFDYLRTYDADLSV